MFRYSSVLIFVLLVACNGGKNKPDVSHIKVDISIERFEKSFFKIDTNNVSTGLMQAQQQFPAFYPTFMKDILQVKEQASDTETVGVVRNILTNYVRFYDTLERKYNNLNWLSSELHDGFQYVKYYYPDYKVPKVITFVGPLDVPGVALTPQYLAIGLHQYAGKNSSAYQGAEVQDIYPLYISRRFDKEYMTPNCMKAIVDDVYPDKSTGRPMIEQMIEKGKQWFLLDHFLPDAADSVKTGFTQKQLNWCKENEGNVWGYIIKNENLYSIEPTIIQNYIGEAPYTQGMPETSPGNIGQWTGWRIVQKYAAENSNLSVQQILQTPARTIFEASKYKPK